MKNFYVYLFCLSGFFLLLSGCAAKKNLISTTDTSSTHTKIAATTNNTTPPITSEMARALFLQNGKAKNQPSAPVKKSKKLTPKANHVQGEQTTQTLQNAQRAMQRCVERAAAYGETYQSGRLEIQLEIQNESVTKSVMKRVKSDSYLRRCLTGVFSRLSFPDSEKAFSFTFSVVVE